ncbi:MAG TPA: D-alanyl-D-alanine carboxypeptidase/D-alanyl-D-alanine-endopeptidase [Burkholderiales bacterium]|nr:D-alanyl-D-alanine carboxypeptidase/D-alanyl-D-alanine-endopeptidase [Burkholderiales bacterium]
MRVNKIKIKFIATLLLLTTTPCFAAPQILPTIPNALKNKVAVSIIDSTNANIVYQYRESTPMLLASNMKLLTSYAALQNLGANFTWKTTLSYSGKVKQDNLDGNLYLIGGGDPTLTTQSVTNLFMTLKNNGINTIQGNLILDTHIFNQNVPSSELYPEPYASYSVDPKSLIIDENISTLALHIKANKITFNTYRSGKLKFDNQLKLINAKFACNDLSDYVNINKSRTSASKSKKQKTSDFVLTGNIPASCDGKNINFYLLDNNQYNRQLVALILKQQRIKLKGKILIENAPASTIPIAEITSQPLAQTMWQMNKQSNNLYAKSMLLSLGAYRSANDATYENAKNIYYQTFKQNLNFPELKVENGSGLSRYEQLSAAHMTTLLYTMYHDKESVNFINSLPTPGESGTLQTEFGQYKTQLHAKTGSLSDTKAYSGYFYARNGHVYAISFLANGISRGDAGKTELQTFKQFFADSLESLNMIGSKP